MLSFEEEWEKILHAAGKQSINFSNFYSDHEIRKLSLYKLKIPEVQQKVAEFAVRYNSDNLQSSKTWMENEYRIFLWTLLHLSEIVGRPPI